ncbi:MAG: GTPase HflX [Oligoflexales bacterium]|nr:GTPase HflX [Oligoflexales bacterium]
MIETALPQTEKNGAVLVSVLLGNDETEKNDDELNELEALMSTLGIPSVGRITQKRQKYVAGSLLGSGKILEIKGMVEAKGASVVVFDQTLTPPQVRNLEKEIGCEILDRTGVILEIFSRHARTNEAKIQVEIARLQYLLPRLSGAWTHFQRQKGGGVTGRGMGEKQIEIDRRRARERISKLRKQLEQIQKDKQIQRKSRSSELRVAIVGYTNSGKTTVMRGLTKSQVEGKNELFATLDTNIKIIDPRTRPKILLSDTVGFIRNLPHSLVESFKSTLDEVVDSDLLLIIVDVSHQCYKDQLNTTLDVLGEIGASDVPHIVVFNKVDLLDDRMLPRILTSAYQKSIVLSAFKLDDIERLRNHIYDFFCENFIEETLYVPIEDSTIQSMIYNSCMILHTDYTEEGHVAYTIQTTKPAMERLVSMLKWRRSPQAMTEP